MNSGYVAGWLVVIFLCLAGGFGLGISAGIHQVRLDAARVSVGEFRVVSKLNNATEFVWIVPTNTKTNK